MNPLSGIIARLAVRAPVALALAGVAVVAASLWLVHSRVKFDSEVLNLLPAGSQAVEGMKIYNSHFDTSRELVFLVQTSTPERADAFVDALRRQPWVERILDGSPLETTEGRRSLPLLVAPVLLNQDPASFSKALDVLAPERIQYRLNDLAGRVSAGSPLARVELETDPLGILSPFAESLSEKLGVSQGFELTTGNSRLVPVVTTQSKPAADECSAMMRQVEQFLSQFQASPDGAGMQIGVTGRSAYVDQISTSMERDIKVTSLCSLLVVAALYWFAFRSVWPLVGSVLILASSCLAALAIGSFVFEKLNLVAIGFCSMLVGMGDDFSLLLYQRYLIGRKAGLSRQSAIRDSISSMSPGVLWAATSTGLGFAALVISGSQGFAQLGILFAIGIAASAVGMIVFLPLFEHGEGLERTKDRVSRFCEGLLKPRIFPLACCVLGLATVIAVAPWRKIAFDTSTHSLEPGNIPAAVTLARITALYPAMFEPVMVVVPPDATPSSLRNFEDKLQTLKDKGLLDSFSSPLAFVRDPSRIATNSNSVRSLDLDGIRTAIDSAEKSARLRPGSLDGARQLVDLLADGSGTPQQLPASSPWLFVVERAFSKQSGHAIFYIKLADRYREEARAAVEEAAVTSVPGAMVSGWSQMLHTLAPWAKQELLTIGGAVLVVIVLVLALTYRGNARLILLHLLALALAVAGTVATLKLAGHKLNVLNVLAFPLILSVGVDYGVYLVLAALRSNRPDEAIRDVMKPVMLSGFTAMTGFGALSLASNPSLRGLGVVCAIGIAWSLFSSLCFLAPVLSGTTRKSSGKP